MRKRNILRAAGILAAVILSVSLLAACAEAGDYSFEPQTQTVEAVSAADNASGDTETAETPVDQDSDEDEDTVQQLSQLDALLMDIRNNVQIGTAGGGLKTAQEAVKLMQWSVNTPLSGEQIEDHVAGFIEGLSEDEADEFEMQLMAVDDTYKLLLEGGQENLMGDAGISYTDIPFGSDSIEAVESIMKAAGLR